MSEIEAYSQNSEKRRYEDVYALCYRHKPFSFFFWLALPAISGLLEIVLPVQPTLF